MLKQMGIISIPLCSDGKLPGISLQAAKCVVLQAREPRQRVSDGLRGADITAYHAHLQWPAQVKYLTCSWRPGVRGNIYSLELK